LSLADSNSLHLLDLEGHGLSPTSAASIISIASYAADIAALAQNVKITGATVVAHGMGCLIAETLAINHPDVVARLILMGPPPSPVAEGGRSALIARAAIVRSAGMVAVVDAVTDAVTSASSRVENPIAIAAIRMSLLSQDPEGYAKGCTALAGVSAALPVAEIKAKTLIITGDEDKVSPPAASEVLATEIQGATVKVLVKTGRCHIFENLTGVANAVKDFLANSS
jgi:pimeloyl-ACP methyl ester carboxylesterase